MPQPLNPIAQAVRMAFKGLQDWIEVFRVGTHTDSKGRTTSFTAKDLDQMVSNVDGAGVPFVIGHPKHDDPAWAWAKPGDVKRDGDSLWVRGTDINADFQQLVDDGAYRERSVKIAKVEDIGWKLLHVGFLGASPPAIAGMKALYQAAEPTDPEAVFEYAMGASSDAGWALGDVARLMRGMRDWLIEDKGLEVADRVLPDWTITSVGDAGRRLTEAALQANGPAFTRNPTGDHPMPQPQTFTQADIDRVRTEAAAAEALKFTAQGQELSELRAERQAERIGVLINGWKAAGKLTPAEEHGMAEFLAAIESGQGAEFAFTAADAKEAKKTPAQFFADFVAGRKPVIKLNASTAGADTEEPESGEPSNAEVAGRAKAYQSAQAAKGIHISTSQAVTAVHEGKDKP